MRTVGVSCSVYYLTSHSEFPFEKYSTVVDVGGGIGAFSLALAKRHKDIKITIQDLPEVLVQARGVSTLLLSHPAQWSHVLLGLGRRVSRGSPGEPNRICRA